MAAVPAGNATGIGCACPGEPGQCPEVSRTWAATSSRTAAWISGAWISPRDLGSVSWSDQRPLSIPKPTPPRAEAIEERMTRASASARTAPTWPLSWIVASDTLARRWRSAAGSALAPKLASPTVTIVEVRMASSRLTGSRRADRSRRSTNDARVPRALTAESGPGGGRSVRWPRRLLMMQTLRTDGRITSAGREWLRAWRAIVAGTKGPR